MAANTAQIQVRFSVRCKTLFAVLIVLAKLLKIDMWAVPVLCRWFVSSEIVHGNG
jgi:hypothetical protein